MFDIIDGEDLPNRPNNRRNWQINMIKFKETIWGKFWFERTQRQLERCRLNESISYHFEILFISKPNYEIQRVVSRGIGNFMTIWLER